MNSEILPFYDDPWRGDKAEAARAIWDWHLALRDMVVSGGLWDTDLPTEAAKLRDGQACDVPGPDVARRVLLATQKFCLDTEEFAMQLEAAERLVGEMRFDTLDEQRLFLDQWICPVGRLLASLANVSGILHVGYVNAMSHGFYLLNRILELPHDVPNGRVFIPRNELLKYSVEESQLMDGPPDEQVKKLLWKQCVRIRDYFARALPLSRDLSGRYASSFKRWWLGGLEMVSAIERRRYDVWTAPVRLSYFHVMQARFQARFSRTLARRK